MRNLSLAAATVLLAGCQTWGPTWSEATGQRFFHTTLNRMPTVIENVDGRSPMLGAPIRFEPGRRQIELQGIPPSPDWRGSGTLQTFTLDAEPCKRYYLNAQFDGALGRSNWTPVIDHVEAIPGCSAATAK